MSFDIHPILASLKELEGTARECYVKAIEAYAHMLLALTHDDAPATELPTDLVDMDLSESVEQQEQIPIAQYIKPRMVDFNVILKNEELNRAVIALDFPEEMILFLRTLIHEYRPHLTPEVIHYLRYLIEVEEYPLELLQYFMIDQAKAEFVYDPNTSIYLQQEHDLGEIAPQIKWSIDLIEQYIQNLREFHNQQLREWVVIAMSEKEISFQIIPQKMTLGNKTTVSYFQETFEPYAMMYVFSVADLSHLGR